MNDTLRRITQARAGGAVRRCHAYRQVGTYTNAEHQWGCALLLWCLWPERADRLIPFALFHDVAEHWVGDVPAPTMRFSGIAPIIHRLEQRFLQELDLPNEVTYRLTEDDKARLKACDRLELYFWTLEQQAMGNRYAREMQKELERYFVDNPLPDRAAELYNHMRHAPDDQLLPICSGEVRRVAEALRVEDQEKELRDAG